MSDPFADDKAAAETTAAPAAVETKAPKAGKAAKVAVDASQAVYALARITYGAAQDAQPGDLFVPVSTEEREYLLKIEAVRELTAAEAALFEKLNG